jgi:dTDP-4-amino-4,6-dideoxygalactose transaminase
MIKIAHPLMGDEERKAVLDVLDSGVLAQGPRVQAFEEEFSAYCGMRYAVATSSGTAALHTALLAHGIGPGCEVITVSFTFIATANTILYTGARPVFVDIDASTFTMQPALISPAVTPRTKAILPVHLFGLPCDMPAIAEIASRLGLAVIEDACQSHGAMCSSRMVGSFGTGIYSFYPTKNMTSAEGGMITTDDRAFAEECRAIRQQGARRRDYHDELGFNYRMTDVHAAIGLAQLRKLDRFNQARRSNAAYFDRHLHGVMVPVAPAGREHVYHQYTVRIPHGMRDPLAAFLAGRGIETGIYYPVPVHRQPSYTGRISTAWSLPETEQASEEVLSLPIHPALSQEDLQTIADAVNDFMSGPVKGA